MPERKDARTPEKFFITISKNHQLNTPPTIARALPNPSISLLATISIGSKKTASRNKSKICQNLSENTKKRRKLLGDCGCPMRRETSNRHSTDSARARSFEAGCPCGQQGREVGEFFHRIAPSRMTLSAASFFTSPFDECVVSTGPWHHMPILASVKTLTARTPGESHSTNNAIFSEASGIALLIDTQAKFKYN
jgi:hypothetical protein